MKIKISKWSLTAYKWMCWIALVLSIIQNSINYHRNKGKVTSVDYRIFNQSPEDKYPSFSICVEMKNSPLNSTKKENHLGLRDFFLLKFTSIYNNGDIVNNSSMIKGQLLNFDINTTMETPSMAQETFGYQNDEFYDNPNLPDWICMTRNNSHAESAKLVKSYDILVFNKTTLEILGSKLKIYIHYPGQLMRRHHKHEKVLILTPNNKGSSVSKITFQLVYVSVSRLREDALIACRADISDEDKLRRMYITGTLGCIPGNWAPIDGNKANLDSCNNENLTKIESLYQMLNSETELILGMPDGTMKRTRGSCNRMSVISLTDEVLENEKRNKEDEKQETLTISIRYVAQSYQEIITVRDVTLVGLVSLIGGYAGLLVGVSIMQIPEIMISFFNWIRKVKDSRKSR